MLRLVRPDLCNTDVFGLFVGQFSDLRTDAIQVQPRDFLIQVLRQYVHLIVVIVTVLPKLNLCQNLVGERVGHDETRVAGAQPKVHQATLGKQDDSFAVRENDVVDLRLDVFPLVLLQVGDINLVVESDRCCRRCLDCACAPFAGR